MRSSTRRSCATPRSIAASVRTAAAAFCAAAALSRPAAALEAAAAKVDITPDLASEKTLLAGFDATGRKPEGVHDPLYARLVLLREGSTTVALVGLDLLGFYHNDVADLRQLAGYDVPGRALFLSSTHTHSGPDTLGLWGSFPGVSGVNKKYQRRIKEKIAQTLKLLESQLRPVRAEGARRALDPRGLCRDTRDPQVIDPDLAILRLTALDGKAVATIVELVLPPEVLQRASHLVTADFPGPLCARVEEKTGGACLYFQGMIGGLMTPDSTAQNFYEAYRIGTSVADAALALKSAEGPRRALAVRSERVLVPVENSRFRLFLPALVFGHKLLDKSGRPLAFYKKWTLALHHLLRALDESNEPWVETEVMVVDVGPARILGMPAEVFPEVAIGGYDGRYSYGRPVITAGNTDPPDLSKAPKAPYLRDLVKAPVPLLVGLANDELGYVVPAYDFKVAQSKSLEPHPAGHYEETNSVGPSLTRILTEAAARLLKEDK